MASARWQRIDRTDTGRFLGKSKSDLLGHDNSTECCVFAPPASHGHLATLAGLKIPPAASSLVEYVASGARDKA